MSDIQTLIGEFYHDPEHAEIRVGAVIDALRTQETLYAAWFPATKHYFMTGEFGSRTAVLFSERDCFERFAESCKERDIRISAIPNPAAQRELLFMDLLRCGFQHVMIDYLPRKLVLCMEDLARMPDMSALPLAERPILAPDLTGSLLWFLQQLHTGRADGKQELRLLVTLYHSPLLMPVERTPAGDRIPAAVIDGRKTVRLFTDRREWAAAGTPAQYHPRAVWFHDLQKLLSEGFDAAVINPDTGAELTLDASLLEAAAEAAVGDTQDMVLRSLQFQGEKITITDPDPFPEELAEALRGVLRQHPDVRVAFLRVMKRQNAFCPNYLLIVEGNGTEGKDALFSALARAAAPCADGWSLECVSYEKAKMWTKHAKPFYQKKSFFRHR